MTGLKDVAARMDAISSRPVRGRRRAMAFRRCEHPECYAIATTWVQVAAHSFGMCEDHKDAVTWRRIDYERGSR